MIEAVMPASLARWFAAFVPFVDGRSDVVTLQQSLGPVAAPSRLALMPEFVRWQATNGMRTLYGRLATTWELVEPGAFDRAVRSHLAHARAKTAAPWSIGEGFAEALEVDAAPAWAAEMADIAWVSQVLRTTDVAFDMTTRAIDPRLVVRFYAFEPGTTTPRAGAWLLFRDGLDRVVRESVNPAEIALVGELQGDGVSLALTPEVRAEGLARLGRLGLLGDRPCILEATGRDA